MLAASAACVTTQTRYYLFSPQNPTYAPAQAEPVLAEYTRLQCPARRQGALPDSGGASFLVETDSLGVARRAQLLTSTRDSVLDGVYGTVAAQLRFPNDSASPGTRSQRLGITFRCAGDSASVRLVTATRPL